MQMIQKCLHADVAQRQHMQRRPAKLSGRFGKMQGPEHLEAMSDFVMPRSSFGRFDRRTAGLTSLRAIGLKIKNVASWTFANCFCHGSDPFLQNGQLL